MFALVSVKINLDSLKIFAFYQKAEQIASNKEVEIDEFWVLSSVPGNDRA